MSPFDNMSPEERMRAAGGKTELTRHAAIILIGISTGSTRLASGMLAMTTTI